ncbi:hypothetical protein IQ241_13065 [Romeria aff. gracilis LEGE 07310]|uniref:Small integral membrane protein n=1 Tax=Vasconcelosia minhoensis LEGE 07310 TaxID=915328 RepID=A0A8J7AQ02_9CYAN|nr:TMEM14 family protein [Romeria gracilis]MBE9078211.1 hypothetical protein [Romeria aff. gracilis LEGE 07310]
MPILITLAYGLLAVIGGVLGYTKAGSKISLISGIVSGLLLIAGAVLYSGGNPVGLLLAQIVTLVLVIVFIIRLVKTRKFMPAGLMVIAGVITLIALFSAGAPLPST